MNITKHLGMLVLAIYLIVVGILGLGIISIGGLSVVVSLLALVAGVLIRLGR
ncbi:MAG: hypothetical protein KGK07_15350 [Chloroflexota bacterium]|nr:hypothetical protein [Chloroflexota bacterium]